MYFYFQMCTSEGGTATLGLHDHVQLHNYVRDGTALRTGRKLP